MNVPIIIVLIGPVVAPIDKVQMKPCFMMATLISRSQAECFSKFDGNPVVLRNPQKIEEECLVFLPLGALDQIELLVLSEMW